MHQIKHSASPYLYKIVLDSKCKLSGADINKFKKTVSQGVAVYGFTPNIIIISNSHYAHWDSISVFAKVMDTGKLAICSNDNLSGVIKNISTEFTSINVKLFGKNDIKDCNEWITSAV
ncbi:MULTISPECIES: hypothetical protein [unclassified Pseudoalteromonas]|uniref:hypothetical protein n=1 Tax=unclassified Pseudoalteromonas TaxID=194690 RepID=UPI00046664DC|nr:MULTISPECIES: hypothetical protein [unclassified Pseudoalteromonas]MBB1297007.1 hypothetical protein [Pseudoalteromonas sp. SR41-7]